MPQIAAARLVGNSERIGPTSLGVAGAMLSSTAMVDLDALVREGMRPLRRVEYDKMVEMGLFQEMSPQGPAHADVVWRLSELFMVALQGRAVVRCQLPVALSEESEPEPDLVVSPPGNYSREHPAEAHLIVEVADSSLRKDRRIKEALYAAAGVPEYWLVNLVDKVVEVHREPGPDGYASIVRARRGESIAPLRFPELVVLIDHIVPG
jgi:Uma2 family endonuclease